MSEPIPPTARPLEPVSTDDPRVQAFARLVAVVDRLRAPDGCPWDRKQTLASMAPHLVEEAHEVVEAIETGSTADVNEECGDVMMTVLLLCKIAEQDGAFDLGKSSDAIADKLIRRHPHVFGDVHADTAEQVLVNWEAIKKQEREDKDVDASALAGVPKALPALQRAHRLGSKAMSAGFRWNDVRGAFEKLVEEEGELREVLERTDFTAGESAADRADVEHELGDVLLASAFLANYLGLDPEKLCRDATRRFDRRFRGMESELGGSVTGRDLDTLMAAWRRAKAADRA